MAAGFQMRADGLANMADDRTFEHGMQQYNCGNQLIGMAGPTVGAGAIVLLGVAGALPGAAVAAAEPGAFAYVTESMSARAAIFQSQATGVLPGVGYVVDGVVFDGFEDGVLLDAKGPGYATLLDPSATWSGAMDGLVAQAERQLAVAGSTPIRWIFAEEAAAAATRATFADLGLDIEVAVAGQ